MLKKLLIIALALGAFGTAAQAQCVDYARNTCRPQISPYVHDGGLNAVSLRAGQTAELKKNFYAGQNYRILVGSQESLAGLELTIKDSQGKVLYQNTDDAPIKYWDFNTRNTTQLTIAITAKQGNNPGAQGCVAVLFGFLTSQDLINQYGN